MLKINNLPFEVTAHHVSLNLLYGKSAIARLMGYAAQEIRTIKVWSEKKVQVVLEGKGSRFLSRQKLDDHFHTWRWEQGKELSVRSNGHESWLVVNSAKHSHYLVEARDEGLFCTCDDFNNQLDIFNGRGRCKHVCAVLQSMGFGSVREYMKARAQQQSSPRALSQPALAMADATPTISPPITTSKPESKGKGRGKGKRSPEEVAAYHEERVKDASELLQTGLAEFMGDEAWQRYLMKQAKFHQYSFNNTLLILIQKPDATRCAGFKTWQRLGRTVRRGEKGIAILAPNRYQLKDDNGDPIDSWVIKGFRVTHTFDISQTDGEPLDEGLPPSELVGGDEGLYQLLQQFSESRRIPVTEEICHGGAHGVCYYNPDGTPKRIAIAPGRPLANRIKTLLHEIGHSLMHSPVEYAGHNARSQAELEAESFAFVMAHHFGIDASGYSFRYLASWGGEDASEKLQAIGSRVQKSAKEAINAIESFASTNSAVGVAA